jgi:hypothetical protein
MVDYYRIFMKYLFFFKETLKVSPGFERNATLGFRCVADK